LVLDYGDQIANPASLFQTDPARWRRRADEFIAALPPETRGIHGHFSGTKYLSLRPRAQFITWVRHPVARLISHYFYYKEYPGDAHAPHEVHLAVKAGISFADFAALPTIRNMMTNLFLRDVSFDDLAFVGVQERYATDLAILTRQFGWPTATAKPGRPTQNPLLMMARRLVGRSQPAAKPGRVNENPHPGYEEEAATIRRDRSLLRKLEEWNANDMALFERAMVASESRRAA
jgi:hypothetical protein